METPSCEQCNVLLKHVSDVVSAMADGEKGVAAMKQCEMLQESKYFDSCRG